MADDRMKVSHQQASFVFSDLIESLIVDISTEAHRAARLGFDYKLNVEEEEEVRLAAHARAVVGDSGATGTEIGNKHTIDVFGQTHPTIANEMFECMNCGRPIVAGRFAPHLEKCMGKGRKARIKASRNLSTSQQRRVRSSPISSYGATGSGTPTAGRTPPNRTPNRTLEDIHRDLPADTSNANNDGGESEESHDDDEKDLSYGVPRPGKARSRKSSGVRTSRANLTQTSTSSGLVPVPLQVSPVRPSCAASVAGLAEAGLTVEVAVEQFNSFVSGRVPPSCGMAAPKKGSKQHAPGGSQGHVKIRRAGEKKKNLGQVLAGSSPVMKCGEPGAYGDMNVSKGQSLSVVNGADGLLEQERSLQNGSLLLSGKVMSNSSSDLYSNGGERSYVKGDLSVEPSSTTGPAGDSGKRPAAVMAVAGGGRVGNGKGKSHARLGLGVGAGGAGMRRTRPPQGAGDGDPRAGNEEMTDFGKKKKRLRAASKPKQGQQAPVAVSASGITTK